MTPKRLDSLPYSKIKAIRHRFGQKLLASRTAPVGPDALPPAAFFACLPTPSYVVSPQLAARLPESIMSSLSSNLRVYEEVPDEEQEFEGSSDWVHVEERDCTPEVFVDEDLQGSGDVISYYGWGQSHIVGILDMSRTESTPSHCPTALQSHMASLMPTLFKLEHGGMAATSMAEDTGSWTLCRTEQGLRKIIHINSHVDPVQEIATVSMTVNQSVPIQGVDPDRTCPHIRIAALQTAAGARTETDPYTSLLARKGEPASEQAGCTAFVSYDSYCAIMALSAMQQVMGGGVPKVCGPCTRSR